MATKLTQILGIWQNSSKALFLFRIFEHLSGQAGSSGSEQPTGRHLITPSFRSTANTFRALSPSLHQYRYPQPRVHHTAKRHKATLGKDIGESNKEAKR